MMVKKYWNDQTRNITIGGVLAGILLGIASYLSSSVSAFLFTSIPAFLGSEVTLPVWLMALIILPLLFLSSLSIKSSLANTFAFDSVNKPDFLDYTQDYFFEIHWSWEWSHPNKYKNKHTIENLHARCPKCKTQLSIRYTHDKLVSCINKKCSWEWPEPYWKAHSPSRFRTDDALFDAVDKEIDRKIYTGEWKSD